MALNFRALLGACGLAATLLVSADAASGASRIRVPLPKARPAEAPKALPQPAQPSEAARKGDDKPADEKAAPQPTACRLALTEEIAIAPSLPPITGPGACGGEDIVRLETVVLPDKTRVSLKPAATLRCPMAMAIAEWIRADVASIAAGAGTALSELDNFDSFDCRGRNRVAGARLSEHGRANAIDVRGVKFANGQFVSFTDRSVARALREKLVAAACARFTTVLGPGSDWYHEDHVHLDLAQRRSGYRICQWDIWDPLPKTAPLLPAGRPEEAPPRESAEDRTKRQEAEKKAADEAKPGPAAAPSSGKKERSKKGAGKSGALR